MTALLDDFLTFLRFKSVSTDPAYKNELVACCDWLQGKIGALGFKVERWESEDHPVLFATHMEAGPEKPTLLIYNHYDVQPVDPENEWTTPPFEPTVRDGEVYARGAQDNKGQCYYVYRALKALLEKDKKLPINVKWIIEGEEECGSESLSKLLKKPEKQQKLKSDYLVIVDMGLHAPDQPAITLGVRGIATLEARFIGSKKDLHSGSHGGITYNPLHALVEVLAQLRDKEGRVTVPGFYDDVEEISASDKKLLNFEFDPEHYRKMVDAEATGGEKKYPPAERGTIRPTLEINGISGGYAGVGFKTVLPAKAIAKISCRLVPHQDPDKIAGQVGAFLKKLAPAGIKVEVEEMSHSPACRANPNSAAVKAFSQAYEELFKKPCQSIFSGGTIPIASELKEASQAEILLMGFGLPDDQIHAPDEHFGIDRLEKGAFVITRALEILGKSD